MASPALIVVLALAQAAPRSSPKPAPPLAFEEVARRASAAREADRLEEAIRWYREGTRRRPTWDEGLWYLATLLYERDRYGEARGAFRQFLALKPDAGPAWALRGMCEFRLKEYEAALTSLQKGTELGYGSNAAIQRAAWFHLAMLLVRGGQFELAVRPLIWLARSEPESAGLVDVAGLCLLRVPQLPADIPPGQKELVTLAGRAAFAQFARDGQGAKDRFRELLERYPRTPNVHYAHGIFLLTSDSDAGMAELRQEIAVQPGSVFARLDLAFELIRRGDFASAREPAEEAVRLAPGLFASHHALGRVLSETDELERGIAELEEAARLAPDSPEMHFALARAYTKAGRKEDAARARATFGELDRKRREKKEGPLVELKSGEPQ